MRHGTADHDRLAICMTRRAWWLVATIGCAAQPTAPADPAAALAPSIVPQTPAARSWRPLANTATFHAAVPQLLTDGTVMVQELDSESWWRLTPDITGGYEHGTWAQAASMASGYSPLYYGSAVLPDGRLIVIGGEYIISGCSMPIAAWTRPTYPWVRRPHFTGRCRRPPLARGIPASSADTA